MPTDRQTDRVEGQSAGDFPVTVLSFFPVPLQQNIVFASISFCSLPLPPVPLLLFHILTKYSVGRPLAHTVSRYAAACYYSSNLAYTFSFPHHRLDGGSLDEQQDIYLVRYAHRLTH